MRFWRKGLHYWVLTVGAVLLMSSNLAYGQGGTGSSIRGNVVDPSGGAVPDASVTLLDQRRGVEQTRESDGTGAYLFRDLLPGLYRVTVEVSGFRRFIRGDLDLPTSKNLRIDVILEVGAVTQEITVTGTTPIIETEAATISVSTRNATMNDMPMAGSAQGGRLPHAQYFVTTGAMVRVGTLSMNGLPEGENSTRLHMDGIRVAESCCQIIPTLEMIDEMKMIAHNAPAEFKTPGTIQFTSRSGTNGLHGDAWWLYNDRGLHARPASLDERPIRHFNMYLWSVGGPIKKNKVFFYQGAEIHRYGNLLVTNSRIPPFAEANVPTTLMQSGDFSELLNQPFADANLGGTTIQLTDPTTGAAIPGNILSAATTPVSAVSTSLISRFWGPPATPGLVANLFQDAWRTFQRDKIDQRIDYYITPTTTFFARYGHTRIVGLQPSQPFLLQDQTNQDFLFPSRSAGLALTWLISPTMTNELRYGFSRTRLEFSTPFATEDVFATAGGLNTGGVTGPPALVFPTGAGNNVAFSRLIGHTFYSGPTSVNGITNNVTMIKGKHSIKFGFEFARRQSFAVTDVPPPTFNFNGEMTGWNFADFMFGIPSNMSRTLASTSTYRFQDEWGFFVQDEFRVRPDVTVTVGVRYDQWPYGVEKNDKQATFSISDQAIIVPTDAARNLVVASFPQGTGAGQIPVLTASEAGFASSNPRSLINTDTNNISPRFGVAWRPGNNLVVRGGYGIYLYNNLGAPGTSTGGSVFNASQSLDQSLAQYQAGGFSFPDPFAGFGPVAQIAANTLSFGATSGQLNNPLVHEWSASVERQFGEWGARFSYFGMRESNFQENVAFNINSADSVAFSQALRPVPLVKNITLSLNDGYTNSNGFQFEIRRPMARGLMLNAGYTYVKNTTTTRTSGPRRGEKFGLDRFKSNRNFMFSHQVMLVYSYELPVGHGKPLGSNMSSVLNVIVGGWRLTGATVLQTGRWLTPFYTGISPAGIDDGSRSQAPDLVGEPELSGSTRSPSTFPFFNTSAYQCPGGNSIGGSPNLLSAGCPLSTPGNVGRFGNSAPALIQGPGLNITNWGIRKKVNLPREGANLDFGIMLSNPFNHPNWQINPNINLSSSTPGLVTGVGEEFISPFSLGNRDITLQVRINF